jgi:hypothetical protein
LAPKRTLALSRNLTSHVSNNIATEDENKET